MKIPRPLAAILFLVAINVGSLLHAQSYSFRRVVNSSTTVPGTSISFGNRDVLNIWSPSISGSNVAFGWFNRGIFLEENGSLDTLLQSPAQFRFALSGSSHVAANSLFGDYPSSIVRETGGSVTTLVDTSTSLPGVVDTISNFGVNPAVSGDNVVFTAYDGMGSTGVYTYINGVVSLVAETGTERPDQVAYIRDVMGQEGFYDGPSISGSNVAFVAEDYNGDHGLYTSIGGTLGVVAVTDTQYTGLAGPINQLTHFRYPSMSGSDVAFQGTYYEGTGGSPALEADWGIYGFIDGTMRTFANIYTKVPGGGGVKFSDFGEHSFVDGQAAFLGSDANGGKGIYLGPPGAHTGMGPGSVFEVNALPVIQKGDLLDGRIVADLGFSRSGYDGTSVAFSAEFTDGTAGIYVASMGSPVPEPSTVVMGALALCGLGVVGWRRRRAG